MLEELESKLVGEIDASGGPFTFNTSMSDVMSTEEEDESLIDDTKPGDLPAGVSLTPESKEEEVIEEKPAEEEAPAAPAAEEEDEDPYKDYSEAALVIQALKEKRPDIFTKDVNKDVDWAEMINNIDGYISESLKSGQDQVMNQVGEAKEYVEFLLSGGDPKTLESALQNVEYSKINVETATDEQKETVVRAMYKDMGLPTEEIDSLVETQKLAGKMDSKAGEATRRFDAKEKNIMTAAKEQKLSADRVAVEQRTELTNSMNKLIEGGSILGMNIDPQEQKALKEAFFSPTEIREVSDGKGGVMTKRFTKYQILEAEFKGSLEKQIAFGKLLLDGFTFDKIKNQAKKERDGDILSVLSRRGGEDERPRSREHVPNAYLSPTG